MPVQTGAEPVNEGGCADVQGHGEQPALRLLTPNVSFVVKQLSLLTKFPNASFV